MGGLVVARSYMPELEARVVDDPPQRVASLMRDRLLREWKNYLDCIDYFELLNEVAQTGEALKRLTEFTVECCRLLRDEGHRVAVGSFSVGNPPDMARDWHTFKPAVYAADAVALHEYGAPYVWSQPGYHNPDTLDHNWWCLRYRRVRELMARTYESGRLPPFIITECGIDRGLFNEGRRGWKSFRDIAGRVRQAVSLVQRRTSEGRLRPGRHCIRLWDERRLVGLRTGRGRGV